MLNAPNKFTLRGRSKKGEGRGDRGKREMGKGKESISLSPSPQSPLPSFPLPSRRLSLRTKRLCPYQAGIFWPFLLGVYCLYRHFVTDYLLTSVRKFGSNIVQVLIFVIPGEKWTKELKASGGKTWLVESYVHFMKREGAKNVLQYGI